MKFVLLLITLFQLYNCDQLLGVVEYFRHGARGPLAQTSLNPHKWQNWQLGQLTAGGHRMQYLLGYEMRKRYVQIDENDRDPNHILPTSFKNVNIEIHSDNVPRCILSAQAQLTGLYPPGTGPLLENEVQKQASPPFEILDKQDVQDKLEEKALPFQIGLVPVHIYEYDEYTVDSLAFCKKAQKIRDQFNQSSEYTQWVQSAYVDSGFQEQLSRIFYDKGLITIDAAYWIYDWVQVNRAEGYELPAGLTDEVFWKLYNLSSYNFFKRLVPTEESASLQSSRFLYDTIQYFESLINGSTQIKMKLWSGHDTGVAPIVKALQLQPVTQTSLSPPFASNIFLELYQNDQKENYVIIKYQDIERKSALCGGKTCSFEMFRDEINKFVFVDDIAACQVEEQLVPIFSRLTIGGMSLIGFLAIIAIYKKYV